MPTQLLIRAALRPGETVVDGGAHVGMVSLLAAHAVGPTGRVLAFEPNPEIYKRLRWHVEENKLAQVTTFPFALSNEAGSAVLQVPTTGNTGAATLGQLVPRQQGPNVRQFAIETRVGDELFPSLALPDAPMFIKLDVEGHELHLLQGLASVLERRKPSIVLECNVEMLPQNGASADALFRFLEGLGYEAFWLGARWSRFKRRYRLRMGRARPGWRPAKLANVFFMHPDSRSRGRMSSYIEQGPPIMDSPIRVADLPSLPAA
jgi:FkbM family methyltransferase